VSGRDDEVQIAARAVRLPGNLVVPGNAAGVVAFAHGSDSSRHSPRNQFVAAVLQRAGLATLLFDLLTPDEAADRRNVFDIPLLAGRLTAAHDWIGTRAELVGLPIGYFGASTGAAAALRSAAGPVDVAAVVSRGGRVDLAGPHLAAVSAPTLLIVGERDPDVLDLNRAAQRELTCANRLDVVPGATHLFEEPGTLEQVAALARDWLVTYLTR